MIAEIYVLLKLVRRRTSQRRAMYRNFGALKMANAFDPNVIYCKYRTVGIAS